MVILKIFFAFCSLDWLRSLEKTADRLRVVLEYAIFKRLTDPSFKSYKVFSANYHIDRFLHFREVTHRFRNILNLLNFSKLVFGSF